MAATPSTPPPYSQSVRTMATELAEFVIQTKTADIPVIALDRAAMSIASTVASAAKAQEIPSVRIVGAMEKQLSRAGASTIWFDGTKLTVSAAARINALASDASACDDSDMRGIAHIGEVISATSIALGEQHGCSGHDILAAMVLGYEVGGRIDEALIPGRMEQGFHGSKATVFGGACTAARLLGLSVPQTTQAIALAATSIGGLAVAADTSWAREYHAGLSAMTGVQSAIAASLGFVAEKSILEVPRGFFDAHGGQALQEVTRDLGGSWDIVTDFAIKLVPGGHPFHAVAEAAGQAARKGNVRAEAVRKIVISAGQLQDWRALPVHPTDLVSLAHSPVYMASCAIADGKYGWEHGTKAKLEDPIIAQLQDKVEFDSNPPALPDRFPYCHGGTVTIFMENGDVFSSTCTSPSGHGQLVTWSDVDSKYRHLMPSSGLPTEQIERSLEVIHSFRDLSDAASRLARFLISPGSEDR